MAAVVHDIACPLCREKYGNTNGKHQEEDFLVNAGESEYSKKVIENTCDKVFRTATGTRLLKSMYLERM